MCFALSQVVEAKEAGAAGVLGTVANVCGPRGAPVLSSYAAAIGLDCPVEVLPKMPFDDMILVSCSWRDSHHGSSMNACFVLNLSACYDAETAV